MKPLLSRSGGRAALQTSLRPGLPPRTPLGPQQHVYELLGPLGFQQHVSDILKVGPKSGQICDFFFS